MIQVDLQNSIIDDIGDHFQQGSAFGFDMVQFFSVALKFIFLALFIGALYIYEQRELGLLNQGLSKEKRAESAIKIQIQIKAQVIKKLKQTKSQYTDLKNRVFLVQEIASSRLSFIKAMDLLNSFRLETLWFKAVDYNKGVLSLKGYAISKKILDEFLKNVRLRENIFKSSLLRESKLEKIKKVSVRFFSLEITLLN